ncbi:hypothetical protein [Amycolatopsis sp. GM8]|uniref:hypothetical protein n=1 Tax=Amycolatopsis sp. GM8 TaxID=2896530 RepID=UPI001F39E209|nr:hypothetical protein [Amycolatopsis sp. GM8]
MASVGDGTMALAASLRGYLEPERLSGLSAPQATRLLTERTACWAGEQGWTVAREVQGRITRPSKNGLRRARLDLVCTRPAELPAVAIEIDQFGKAWSLRKLLAEVDAGCVALWVRWRGRAEVEIPDTVGLVDIHDTAAYQPDTRATGCPPALDMHVLPSPEEIERARTPAGGFTRAQLAVWGVAWPPPKGWTKELNDRWRAAQTEQPRETWPPASQNED